MSSQVPTREEAFALLKRYNKSESLIKHALAVEGVMRYMARKRGKDEEKWGIIGLIHDLDYEQFPDQHCKKTGEILKDNNWPAEYIRAVVSHGWGICSDVKPDSEMEKVLSAKSVKKIWKQKQFAAGVDRSIIEKGAQMLDVELGELITDTIMGMRDVAEEIGLKGNVE
jgi:predicted hydrolase (HD superfamily)